MDFSSERLCVCVCAFLMELFYAFKLYGTIKEKLSLN